MVLDEILQVDPQTNARDYTRLPRNCLFNHEMVFDPNGLDSTNYQETVNAIAIEDLFLDSMEQDPAQFKLYIICFIEKDECKSDREFVPVVALVPQKYFNQNYLENQPNFSKIEILDRWGVLWALNEGTRGG